MFASIEGARSVGLEEMFLQLASVLLRGGEGRGHIDGRWRHSSGAATLWSVGGALGRCGPAHSSCVVDDGSGRVREGGINDAQLCTRLSANKQLCHAWRDVHHLASDLLRLRVVQSEENGPHDGKLTIVGSPHGQGDRDQIPRRQPELIQDCSARKAALAPRVGHGFCDNLAVPCIQPKAQAAVVDLVDLGPQLDEGLGR